MQVGGAHDARDLRVAFPAPEHYAWWCTSCRAEVEVVPRGPTYEQPPLFGAPWRCTVVLVDVAPKTSCSRTDEHGLADEHRFDLPSGPQVQSFTVQDKP